MYILLIKWMLNPLVTKNEVYNHNIIIYKSYSLNIFFIFHIFMSPIIAINLTVIKLSDHVSPDCRGSMHTLISGQWQLRNLVLVDGCLYVYKHHDHPATSKCVYIEVPGRILGR